MGVSGREAPTLIYCFSVSMDWLVVVILGIIEGITEFLPISSTGHLLMAQAFLPSLSFNAAQLEMFNVVIQSGAVLAVIVVFYERCRQLLLEWRKPDVRDYLLKLIVAFGITGIGGLLLKKLGMRLPSEAAPVAWATFIGGFVIIAIEYGVRNRKLKELLPWHIVVVFGVAQLIAAIFPGASRSGTTILLALAMGCHRRTAVEFSFILGIPTLVSAGGLEFVSCIKEGGMEQPWGLLIVGMLVSALTAFVAVKWLLKYVQSHNFLGFGWYRIFIGGLILGCVWGGMIK